MFESILKAMGIEQYDPQVVEALSEYTRRFTSEILCDAKDYATHAGHPELGADDIKLAMKLHDSRTNAIDPRLKFIYDAHEAINSKPLPHIPEDRLLRLPESNLLQRTFTFVPGREAYPPEVTF